MRQSAFEGFIRSGGSRTLVLKPFNSPQLERKQVSQRADDAVVEWLIDVWSSQYGAVVQSILKTTPFEFSPARLADLDQASLRLDAELAVLAAMEAEGFDLSSAAGERRAVMVLTNFLNQALQKAMGIRFYVWTTQQDARVRESHAEREGVIFQWDSPPEGGHPGEDFGCRCYAHPLGIEGYWEHVSEGIETFTADLEEWEGNVEHIYLDSEGNVTVGKGKRLRNPDSAAALPFLHAGTDSPASDSEIRAEYDLIAGMQDEKGQPASYFLQFTTLYLPQSDIDDLVTDHIRAEFEALLRQYPDFGNLPVSVQVALWDMQYNLGSSGLAGFQLLRQAIRDGDWEEAARQSHRLRIGDDRNDFVFNLFMDAA